jgi:hypothetical protein
VDPLTQKYAFYSPYQFAGNMPILAIDIDGREPYFPILPFISLFNFDVKEYTPGANGDIRLTTSIEVYRKSALANFSITRIVDPNDPKHKNRFAWRCFPSRCIRFIIL